MNSKAIQNLDFKLANAHNLYEGERIAFAELSASYDHQKLVLAQAKLALDAAKKQVNATQKIWFAASSKLRRSAQEIVNLTVFTEKKHKALIYAQQDREKKKAYKKEGKKLSLSLLSQLPQDIVQLIHEFLPFETRTQYLVDLYNPLKTFKKLSEWVKVKFIQFAFDSREYFSHIPIYKKIEIALSIGLGREKSCINNIASILIHEANILNPQGAFHFIQSLCITFKPGKKYTINYSELCNRRQQIRNAQHAA
jgi:hypothetical protein